MKEYLTRAIARRLGLLTQAEALDLVRENVADFRFRMQHVSDLWVRERLVLFKENKRLRDELADAQENIEHLKMKENL